MKNNMKLINKIMQTGIVLVVGNSLLKGICKNDDEIRRMNRRIFYYSLMIVIIVFGGIGLGHLIF